jgi:guanylate kinase
MIMKKEGLLFVVSGASGTGKTTLCRSVLQNNPHLRFSISHTTRPQRPGDVDGRDYYFTSPEEFQAMVARGEFAEWAEIYGHRYGTSKGMLEKALSKGQDLILDIDSQGARQLREKNMKAVFIFLLPPCVDDLKARLTHRNTEKEEALEQRLRKARDEIAEAWRYDYWIINDDLNAAREKLRAIILAEHCRPERMSGVLEKCMLETNEQSS